MRSTNKYKIVSVSTIAVLVGAFFILFFTLFSYEVPGTYVVKHKYATEKIILKKGGAYIHEVTLNGSEKADVVEGLWKYNVDSGYLTFDKNFMCVVDGLNHFIPSYAEPRTSGLVIKPIGKFFGTIVISNGDRGSYKKVD